MAKTSGINLHLIFWLMGFSSAWIISLMPNKEMYLASGNLWYIAYYSGCLTLGALGTMLTALFVVEWVQNKFRRMIWK